MFHQIRIVWVLKLSPAFVAMKKSCTSRLLSCGWRCAPYTCSYIQTVKTHVSVSYISVHVFTTIIYNKNVACLLRKFDLIRGKLRFHLCLSKARSPKTSISEHKLLRNFRFQRHCLTCLNRVFELLEQYSTTHVIFLVISNSTFEILNVITTCLKAYYIVLTFSILL